ncbi:FAD/NAD P-binding domain-containing protein [Gloeophyllum trabeum ATCC 11539]|uniref:FAD/NAD P-binding domain-containing protein n=1 Tax=Gloeophyllum trabeum (strain ATCC 11539 / FP-39264 / Madison 617) TaxID=670483 RepID=S7PYI3_GLOTA|nr:FAD/NAD P-binding domain-containing protein [Gloeophyllum trabeum ATCC 11539]EPQ52711.1 FAD/NAD P-binding domain-containing protein [Gloeophyllum trabeum ATCC 11539]
MRVFRSALQWVLSASSIVPHCIPTDPASSPKSIAIVGAGSGGLAALKALLDLPQETRRDWQIDLFEQRDHVGGIWLAQTDTPSPPDLPDTPMYPSLRTNLPHPTMTYPHFPYPPMTALYPGYSAVQAYHEHFAQHYNLTPYIHFSHTVVNASYHQETHWTIEIELNGTALPEQRYDHLIVANGHNHYPHIPRWDGLEMWLSSSGQREMHHSLWYREPDRYRNHTVVVVGNGDSGRDIAMHVSKVAKKVYHSYDNNTREPVFSPPVPSAIYKPRISHLTNSAIVFTDNTTLSTSGPTTILLATGYDLVVPFLSPLATSPFVDYSTITLTTNRRYIRPLYRHVLALDPELPPNALAFIGLPMWVATAPSDYAQGLFVAHAIADSAMLSSRETMLLELENSERALEAQGIDPFFNGHRLQGRTRPVDYQEEFIAYLRANSSVALPPFLADGRPYVERWRRDVRQYIFLLKKAWARAEELGLQDAFIRGAVTEEEWAEVMERLKEWYVQEEEDRLPTISVLRVEDNEG